MILFPFFQRKNRLPYVDHAINFISYFINDHFRASQSLKTFNQKEDKKKGALMVSQSALPLRRGPSHGQDSPQKW
jgi:hypothetical protein